MNIYQEHGHTNRQAYLRQVAEDYGVPLDVVLMVAELLGEAEDFDGLLTILEDNIGFSGGMLDF